MEKFAKSSNSLCLLGYYIDQKLSRYEKIRFLNLYLFQLFLQTSSYTNFTSLQPHHSSVYPSQHPDVSPYLKTLLIPLCVTRIECRYVKPVSNILSAFLASSSEYLPFATTRSYISPPLAICITMNNLDEDLKTCKRQVHETSIFV